MSPNLLRLLRQGMVAAAASAAFVAIAVAAVAAGIVEPVLTPSVQPVLTGFPSRHSLVLPGFCRSGKVRANIGRWIASGVAMCGIAYRFNFLLLTTVCRYV